MIKCEENKNLVESQDKCKFDTLLAAHLHQERAGNLLGTQILCSQNSTCRLSSCTSAPEKFLEIDKTDFANK